MTGPLRAQWGAFTRTAILAVAAFAATAGAVLAQVPRDTRTWTSNGLSFTFSVPETRSECTASGMTDTLYTQGLQPGWRIIGQVNVGFIGPNSFVITQVYNVNQTTDLNLVIQYPPHTQVLPNPGGYIEYHVEPQLSVVDSSGNAIPWIGGDPVRAPGALGPGGQDWDVFCLQPPPPPPPPGDPRGCTPGYWKVEQHFDSWPSGITPATSFESIFGNIPGADVNFFTALQGGGGPDLEGALKILRRAAAAAYLNSLTPGMNYGFTPVQIVVGVYQVAMSGNRTAILGAASYLDGLNNRSCPLN